MPDAEHLLGLLISGERNLASSSHVLTPLAPFNLAIFSYTS
jgi:hypothetical protein